MDVSPPVADAVKGETQGYVSGGPKRILQAEGLGVLLVSTWLFSRTDLPWLWFFGLFFTPDLSFAGYLGGKRIGAATYNLFHSYVPVVIAAAVAIWTEHAVAQGLVLIWAAHIGFDRMLGYGLKYSQGFGFTHLGRIGKARH